MTARQLQNKTRVEAENMKEWYFVFFENEGTYSITCEDFIKGDAKNLVIGGPVDVRHGKRIFTGKLVSQGPKDRLETLQSTMEGVLNKGSTSKDSIKHVSKKNPYKRLKVESSDEESEGNEFNDDEQVQVEEKRLEKVLKNLDKIKQPIALVHETRTLSNDVPTKEQEPIGPSNVSMEKILYGIQRDVEEIKKVVLSLQIPLESPRYVPAAKSQTKSPRANFSTPEHAKRLPSDQNSPPIKMEIMPNNAMEAKVMYNEVNLLNIGSTPKEPAKCALKLLPQLFSEDEMAEGTLETSKKSKRKLLDQERINTMFDVLRIKYGDKLNKSHQQIIDACNQKCRDAKRQMDAKAKTNEQDIKENEN